MKVDRRISLIYENESEYDVFINSILEGLESEKISETYFQACDKLRALNPRQTLKVDYDLQHDKDIYLENIEYYLFLLSKSSETLNSMNKLQQQQAQYKLEMNQEIQQQFQKDQSHYAALNKNPEHEIKQIQQKYEDIQMNNQGRINKLQIQFVALIKEQINLNMFVVSKLGEEKLLHVDQNRLFIGQDIHKWEQNLENKGVENELIDKIKASKFPKLDPRQQAVWKNEQQTGIMQQWVNPPDFQKVNLWKVPEGALMDRNGMKVKEPQVDAKQQIHSVLQNEKDQFRQTKQEKKNEKQAFLIKQNPNNLHNTVQSMYKRWSQDNSKFIMK